MHGWAQLPVVLCFAVRLKVVVDWLFCVFSVFFLVVPNCIIFGSIEKMIRKKELTFFVHPGLLVYRNLHSPQHLDSNITFGGSFSPSAFIARTTVKLCLLPPQDKIGTVWFPVNSSVLVGGNSNLVRVSSMFRIWLDSKRQRCLALSTKRWNSTTLSSMSAGRRCAKVVPKKDDLSELKSVTFMLLSVWLFLLLFVMCDFFAFVLRMKAP